MSQIQADKLNTWFVVRISKTFTYSELLPTSPPVLACTSIFLEPVSPHKTTTHLSLHETYWYLAVSRKQIDSCAAASGAPHQVTHQPHTAPIRLTWLFLSLSIFLTAVIYHGLCSVLDIKVNMMKITVLSELTFQRRQAGKQDRRE